MHFTTATLLTTLLSTLALAAPAPAAASKSMMASTAQWTIEQAKRVCDAADTSCAWSFTINKHVAGVASTPCAFTTPKDGATPASQSPQTGATCGGFQVTTGWSGQFGPGNGFTTLAVVDLANRLITYPAYTDVQLAGGKVVVPDQSYAPYSI
ncbi:hypothetical protein B0T17DRAFT_502066 [Bombardia bombarda]|uniref:Small secreted protein n=1 Tax=Bombardia bombarda TaxID=252184 RepID=A0AA40CDG2_9PEZI|nr:hypothetical protein B0T17DRAFT_502066 [Bombardia bombarda]